MRTSRRLQLRALTDVAFYEGANEQHFREMDVEVGRWGAANKTNAQYVIQPFYNTSEVTKRGRHDAFSCW
jgi:hypothetical protein